MSEQYIKAKAKMTKAQKTYDHFLKQYRSMEIGDTEFLKAREIYKNAEKEFDFAFSIEQERK